jgi:hypothetical protein
MGTKERKTPVQDTLSGARFNLPDPKAGARQPPIAAKIELEKPKLNFKGGPQKISDVIFPRLILACAS